MGLEEILARDDVPSDVKQIITNLDERLREAEFTNLWNIFSQSEIPTLILSKEGEITNYNDSMEKLTGYSHQEVPDINAWFPKIYPDEEYRSKVFEISRRSQNREITVRRDVFKITRKDGKQRFIEFSVYDVFHAGKSTNLQVVQGVDVTDQKETEGKLEAYRKHLEELVKTRTKDLRESRDLYRVLFESAPIAIGTSDFDGKALTFNQNTLEMMGYTADELKTINLADTYVDPNDRKELLQTLQKVGSVLDREVRRKRKDGSVYHLLMNSERIELGGQQIFLTTMRDITDRKIAVKALRQSEVRYASILRVAPIGIGVVQNRVISFISDSFLEMVGYSRDELLGQNARIVYPSDEEYDRVGRAKYVQIEKFGTGSVDAR